MNKISCMRWSDVCSPKYEDHRLFDLSFWKEVVMAKNETRVTNNIDLGDLIPLTMLFLWWEFICRIGVGHDLGHDRYSKGVPKKLWDHHISDSGWICWPNLIPFRKSSQGFSLSQTKERVMLQIWVVGVAKPRNEDPFGGRVCLLGRRIC